MCTYKHRFHGVQSSHNLKEYFFQSNMENLLEAVLSVIQHRRNMGHRCPFRLVRSCGTRDEACLLSLFLRADAPACEPRQPAAQSPSGQQGAEFIPELSARSLALQFPLSCPSLPLSCGGQSHILHPSPLAWARGLSPTQGQEAPALSLCSQRPYPSTVGQN